MDPAGQGDVLVGDGGGVAPDVDGQAADGGEEDLEVGAGDELGVHAVGHAEDGLTELGLGATEATGNLGEVPDGLDGSLGNDRLASLEEDLGWEVGGGG